MIGKGMNIGFSIANSVYGPDKEDKDLSSLPGVKSLFQNLDEGLGVRGKKGRKEVEEVDEVEEFGGSEDEGGDLPAYYNNNVNVNNAGPAEAGSPVATCGCGTEDAPAETVPLSGDPRQLAQQLLEAGNALLGNAQGDSPLFDQLRERLDALEHRMGAGKSFEAHARNGKLMEQHLLPLLDLITQITSQFAAPQDSDAAQEDEGEAEIMEEQGEVEEGEGAAGEAEGNGETENVNASPEALAPIGNEALLAQLVQMLMVIIQVITQLSGSGEQAGANEAEGSAAETAAAAVEAEKPEVQTEAPAEVA